MSNTRTVESFSQNQAYNIAQSAMMVVTKDIVDNGEDSSFHPATDTEYSYPSASGFEDWEDMEGSYNIFVRNHGDTLAVQSTGQFEESTYRVSVELLRMGGGGFAWPPIGQGVHAETSITLTGSAKVYGDMTINSTQNNAVSFDWDTHVTGNLFVGPGGNPDNVAPNVSQWSPEQVHGERFTMEETQEYELPDFPDFPNSVSTGESLSVTNYIEEGAQPPGGIPYTQFQGKLIEKLSINESRTMTINVGDGDRTLHVRNLDMPQGHLKIEGEGTLTIYVEDNFNFSSGGGDSSLNKNGDASNVMVYYKGQPKVKFGGNTRFNASLYMKESDMELPGSSEIGGIVISGGGDVDIVGGGEPKAKSIYAPNSEVSLISTGGVTGWVVADKFYASGGNSHVHYNDDPSSYPDLPGSGGGEPSFLISYWN